VTTDPIDNDTSLQRAEERFRLVVESSPVAMVIVDRAGRIVLLNQQTENWFGYARDELLGQEIERLVPERFHGRHRGDRNAFIAAPHARPMGAGRELFGRRRDGSEFPVDISLHPMDAAEGLLVMAHIVDLTDRRQAEMETLRQQRDFSDRLLETAQVIVLVLDRDGHVVRFNRFMQDLCGHRLDEVHGDNWFDTFIIDEDREATWDLFRRVVDGEEVRGHVNSVRGKDGRLHQIAWWGKALRDGHGEITQVLSIGHDITALNEIQGKLVQSERLAAIGQMIAGLAHESRNALQRARACLDMLALDLSEQPRQIDLTQRIETALDELQRLYEEVRGYAAPIKLSLGRCDLAELWRMSWQHVQQTHTAPRVTLLEECDGIDTECVADRFRIEQVFRNVLENAVSFSPANGRITLSCEETTIDSKPAIRICIADEGPGVSSEQLERMFEPFYTTKQKGTGLGLPISQRFVEAHGGTIAVMSNPVCGATVTITLPR